MANDSNSNLTTTGVLPPQVAGQFYSGKAWELAKQADILLARAKESAVVGPYAPKAIIVPHAGHRFSGQTAANVMTQLQPNLANIKRVVMLGPAHRHGFHGIAVPKVAELSTPLGNIKIDEENLLKLQTLPQVSITEQAFLGEHCLEVQLPLLQRLLPNAFVVTPLIVGQSNPEQVAQVIETLWGNDETLILISTDLSHFHQYDQAQQLDLRTQKAIETLNFSSLSGQAACGFMPVSGLLYVAQQKGLRVTTIDRCNSGDTGADKSRVVGYGGWRLDTSETAYTPEKLRQRLLTVAAQAIYLYGNTKQVPAFKFNPPDFQLMTQRATFITLKTNGQLRGCIGSLHAHRPLCDDVAHNAIASAFRDSRFPPLGSKEFEGLEIGISVLSQPCAMSFRSEQDLLEQLVPGEDGLILTEPNGSTPKRGTFLPMVWESLPTPQQFLNQLKLKAGLEPNYWSSTLKVDRYKAEKFNGTVSAALAAKAKW